MFEEMKEQEDILRTSLTQLSKKSRYETIISTVIRTVHRSINLDEVLENAVEAMSENMGIDNVFISLVEGQEAVLKAHRGYPEWFIERVRRIPYPRGVTWRVITEGKPMYCPDADNDTFLGPAGKEVGTKSYVSMPIHFGGKAVGVININSLQKNAFDEEELKLLEIVAQQIEAALHNAQIAETLRQSEERYRTLFDQSPVGVFIFNEDFKITQCNERMVQILQSSHDRIIGLDMRGLKDQSFMPAMGRVFEGQSCHQESFYEATTSSAKLWLSVCLSPLRDSNGNVIGGMGVVEDITERKLQEERIHYLATHDSLTDLPNRRVLEENLKRVVDRSQMGHIGALLLIDLDNFKIVNDTLGHLGGDKLLITLAQRLRRTLRPDDLLARFGGDEFALLVEGVSIEEVKAIAERIYQRVTESYFHLNNHSIDLTICIGIALIDGSLNDQAVLALADSALYAAKNFGKSRIVLYQCEDDKQFKLAEIGQWASRIKDALQEKQFVPYFQPVIQLDSGKIKHFEALVRLRNRSGEIILPEEFISAAEYFGLMPQIDRWIVQSVLRILRTRSDLRVFINLSGQSLRDASLLEFIKACIQESRIAPGQLSFEIIETVAATDLVRIQHWMKQLKELGCLFALDDFGIGLSSFSYLRALAVDYIKIDGSFIHNLDTDPANRAIVRAITTVANALNKDVIAEWVENKATTETLRELGVKYGQGYIWGIPSAEIHGESYG